MNRTTEQPAPALAWHREAAEGITDCNDFTIQSYAAETLAQTHYGLAAIIAAHDPHAETVRLLERLINQVEACEAFCNTFRPDLRNEIRTHLAKLKGTQ